MVLSSKFYFVFLILAFALSAVGQGAPVKWELLNGKNKEFAVFMPEKNLTIADKTFYLAAPAFAVPNKEKEAQTYLPGGGLIMLDPDSYTDKQAEKAKAAHVKTRLIVSRHIGGAVLLLTFYEGDVEQIQKNLAITQNLNLDRDEKVGGFSLKNFTGTSGGFNVRTQHYLIDDRLYVLEAISTKEPDRVTRGFFESVRLSVQSGMLAPNAPAGAAKTTLPALRENESLADDSQAFSLVDADRKPVILRTAQIMFSPEMREGLVNFKVKLKVLFSASGKVSKVEVLSGGTPLLNRSLVESISKTVFIPAEKNGKTVPVYQFREINFETTGNYNPVQMTKHVL